MTEIKESTTLFVRNIPFHFTKDKLEDKFSEFGPIKQCFIVNDKVSGRSRGFGYVKFTLLEDAKKAQESDLSLEGRKVSVDYADISKKVKKTPRKPKIKKETENHDSNVHDDSDHDTKDIVVKEEKESDDEKVKEKAKNSQNLKYHKAKIVSVTGLPHSVTDGELNNFVNKIGVKHVAECKLLTGGKEAHLKFKCIRDAKRAIRKLHNHAYKDSMLQAVQMSQDVTGQPQNVLKKSRVIVRNLAFQCNEEQLQKAFSHCGEITEVKIPSNQAGKKLGFGFVQFTRLPEAKKAVEEMNTKKILGRPVAVDWALPKARYENTQQQNEEKSEDEGSSSSDDSLSNDQKETHVKPAQLKKEKLSDEEVGDVSSDDDDDSDDHESSDEDDVGDNSDEEMDSDKEVDSDSDDDGDDDSDSDDENVKQMDNKNVKKKSKEKVPRKSDTDDGCTLFLRNLSFDTTEEGLEEHFSQYGELKYAKVVYNHETEHSKGIGFVRYTSKESADRCFNDAKEGKISLDGRQLMVSVAVSREKAADFTEKKAKEKKDNRNLYLAREGMVRPGTQAAEGLAKIDLDKRVKVEALKRQKLKNLDIFISPLRLCVRNIPVNVDDKKLREVFKTAAGDKQARINECRIMRDRARTNAEGLGKSKSYGFVSFSDHQHALAALRHTNNNPDIFGDKRRLIVEFSLENRKALQAKEKRKAKVKSKMIKKGQTAEGKAKIKQTAKSPVIPLIQLSEKDKKLKGDKVQKGLPSHWGPKIRHKPRPAQTSQGKKAQNKQQLQKGKDAQKRKQPAQQSEGPAQKKQKKGKQKESYDDFDKIVSKYKNKLIGKKEKGKWFE
ncbi:RNA-binding protein 28-like [Mercenaria mercenaria]|uniref:RNA-binding protein 28-like n=1 Tax=Mercenaria mercenaria TaxID=6596 RepID=UPI00234F160B|nr:RNA-binding protein 28-like [Mercenaria mercenaria]